MLVGGLGCRTAPICVVLKHWTGIAILGVFLPSHTAFTEWGLHSIWPETYQEDGWIKEFGCLFMSLTPQFWHVLCLWGMDVSFILYENTFLFIKTPLLTKFISFLLTLILITDWSGTIESSCWHTAALFVCRVKCACALNVKSPCAAQLSCSPSLSHVSESSH